MPSLTTHILDTSTGRPAAGVTVRLETLSGDGFTLLAQAVTDQDGRIKSWFPADVPAGRCRLVFETGAWFTAAGRSTLYPEVVVVVDLQEGEPHYHIPLLLAPFGYSTYRGT
jgi:5-hydroxyisourate hydrolase